MSETDRPDALGLAELMIEFIDGPSFHVPHYIVRDSVKELRRLHEVNQELIDVINSIYIYANDTLSGRVDGPDDRDWQRAGVVEIRNRARRLATIETAVDARTALAKAKGETE